MRGLKQKILSHLRNKGGWVNGGEVEQFAISLGYKGSTGARCCQLLRAEGHLLHEIRKGRFARSVWYSAVGAKRVVQYRIPVLEKTIEFKEY